MNIIKTKDFYLAAYLFSKGFSFRLISDDDPRIKIFVFENDVDMSQQIETYRKKESLVEPITYAYSMKYLKSMIYENGAISNEKNKNKDKNNNGKYDRDNTNN